MHRPSSLRAITRCLQFATLVLCLGAAGWVRAGGISVSPVQVVFTAQRSISAVTLTNTSRETLTVEAEALPWPADAASQTGKDVTVNPPISTLAPGEKITVRVGLVRRLPASVERSYRLYFTELPSLRSQESQGVGVRLRIGIPLFVAADQAEPAPLEWSAQREGEALMVSALNRGNVHQRIARLTATQGAQRVAAAQSSPYVLPGRNTVFRLLGLAVTSGERLSLQVETDDGSTQVDLLVP